MNLDGEPVELLVFWKMARRHLPMPTKAKEKRCINKKIYLNPRIVCFLLCQYAHFFFVNVAPILSDSQHAIASDSGPRSL